MGRPRAIAGALLVAAAALSCNDAPPTLPPLGQALLVVDTDMPVPLIVSRLRVDFFRTDGTWFGSRDLSLSKPTDWPASFGVYLPEHADATSVIVRLRGYPEGHTRDYLGLRYRERPQICDDGTCASAKPSSCCAHVVQADPPPPADHGPRLSTGPTPPTEPDPAVSIDRLLRIPLQLGATGKVSVTLAGACVGTMADMRDPANLRTCIDTEDTRVPVADETLDPDMTAPGPSSLVGSFGAALDQPCDIPPRSGSTAPDGTPMLDEEVCVRGGVFIFGGRDWSRGVATDSLPERVVAVRSFLIDRYEVTVGRVRASAAKPNPFLNVVFNSGTYGDPSGSASTWCTYSGAPQGREHYPINCAEPSYAKQFCAALGASLPSEAQWEYAAAMAGRSSKAHYPWGAGTDSAPACADVAIERSASVALSRCASAGLGPAIVDSFAHAGADMTPTGVVGLGGNVTEMTSDAAVSFAANCWLGAPLRDPKCSATDTWTTRGGYWSAAAYASVSEERDANAATLRGNWVGFRCARSGRSGP